MYFLELINVCEEPNFNLLWDVIGFVVKAIWIGIPIILIVLGMIDLGKAVITSKEDESKKAWKSFGRRCLFAICVFLVVWAVSFVFDFASRIGGAAMNGYDDTSWRSCWCKVSKGSDHTYVDGNCIRK